MKKPPGGMPGGGAITGIPVNGQGVATRGEEITLKPAWPLALRLAT